MRMLVPYLIVIGFWLLSFGIWRLTVLLMRRRARRQILAAGVRTKSDALALFAAVFGVRSVLSGHYLPYPTRNGTSYLSVDCVLLLNGTVAVLRFAPPASAEPGDPVTDNKRDLISLIGIFEKERFPFDPHLENFVIDLTSRASAVSPQPERLSLAEAMKKLRQIERTYPAFSFAERRNIRRAIAKYSVSKRRAAAVNAKLRRR